MNMLFLMNKTKDQISWVLSHDLYWENKMYKRKRSIDLPTSHHYAKKRLFGKQFSLKPVMNNVWTPL